MQEEAEKIELELPEGEVDPRAADVDDSVAEEEVVAAEEEQPKETPRGDDYDEDVVPADDGYASTQTGYDGAQDLEAKTQEIKRKHTRTEEQAP